jgi:hypothetical protein
VQEEVADEGPPTKVLQGRVRVCMHSSTMSPVPGATSMEVRIILARRECINVVLCSYPAWNECAAFFELYCCWQLNGSNHTWGPNPWKPICERKVFVKMPRVHVICDISHT